LYSEVQKYGYHLLDLYEIGLVTNTIPFELLPPIYEESSGVLKRALAALLLLDERSKRRLVSVAARQKIISGKLRAIARHDVVTIDLDTPYIQKAYAGGPFSHHETPIEHEVREHWVQYDVASQCTHSWEPYHSERGDEYDKAAGLAKPLRREICSLCGGRRTRKLTYISGDASKGSNIGKAKYKVIASKEKTK
jgi:hypothetical protein